ncbi:MAG: hypothetical protein K5986_08635 [Clostridium sp.]|uniref:hypothetical protein n=1 Tax=Clostridium sp. DSM 8431 TaxID=1761781 RepID=UPI0008EBB7FE|nr:hypothetical protein [Clostridium sp. DSM 8431]MCR4944498.1 hypothetical protein [Clostridium sp.]SFU62259.1 hypothetical protein SAMN04487886_10786 [Clostridium sp. DSM 8431]
MNLPSISERLLGRQRHKTEEERLKEEQQFKELKEANLGSKDIVALIIALSELLIPIVLAFGVMYFLIILFLTKVWMR